MKKDIVSWITTRWFDSGWMVKAVRLARVVVQTRPVLRLPVFATRTFARPRIILVTYFLWRLGGTRLHLGAPYPGRIAVRRRRQFHRARLESGRATPACLLLFRWSTAVVLAAGTVSVHGGAFSLCRRTVIVSRTVFHAFVVVVDVVVVVEVGVSRVYCLLFCHLNKTKF